MQLQLEWKEELKQQQLGLKVELMQLKVVFTKELKQLLHEWIKKIICLNLYLEQLLEVITTAAVVVDFTDVEDSANIVGTNEGEVLKRGSMFFGLAWCLTTHQYFASLPV